MPAHDLSLLVEAAREAGKIATGFVGRTARRWDKPGDAGPVTEADLAVNAMLHAKLRAARPDYGWLSEESEDDPDRLARKDVFIIDPIDGTRSFVEGSKTWAHALAVAREGVVTAAVVYLPMLDKLYAAARDHGTTLNDAPVAVSPTIYLTDASILTTKPAMRPENWQGRVPQFTRAYRPSLAYRLGLVAEGRYDGMLTLRKSWEWDIAAGALLVTEAGGACTDRTGADLRFNNRNPQLNGVIAASPALQLQIVADLSPA